MPGDLRPGKDHVELEGLRAREFYKYYEPFHNLMTDEAKRNIESDTPTASFDHTLAVCAQLGALRLNARRVVISCFDRKHQYVLAEATRSLCLRSSRPLDDGDELWLGASILDRQAMLCERTLQLAEQRKESEQADDAVFMGDVDKNDWFNQHRDHTRTPPNLGFYAGQPISTPEGQVIGVYSVFGESPRPRLNDPELAFLQDMSKTVMAHLDMVRSKEEHGRTSKMVIGLGSFVEGKAVLDMDPDSVQSKTMTEAEQDHGEGPPQGAPRQHQGEDAPNSGDTAESATGATGADSSHAKPGSDSGLPKSPSGTDLQASMLSTDVKAAFGRAAKIIKNAIDVEGVAFLDASVGSFGGLVTSVPATREGEDMNSYFAQNSMAAKQCPVLGRAGDVAQTVSMTEGFLHNLLRQYPRGRIFNIDPDENHLAASHPNTPDVAEDYGQRLAPQEEQEDDKEKRDQVRKQRQDDLRTLHRLFPKARSLAFVPMWDDHRMRWFAGAVVWSNTDIRLLHKDSELSFLRAFGITIMSEVSRLDTAMADQAKADLLNSISHELRSPLHGILGSLECLENAKLDALQQGFVETIETCGRTLLDTIDHLLDYSKINNFTRKGAKRRKNGAVKQPAGEMLSLDVDVHLPTVTEEALETVFAGYSAVPPAQLASGQKSFSIPSSHHQSVQVIVDIDARRHEGWWLKTEGGAWRRLVMNLTGNALKYTTKGYIHVKLEAHEMHPDKNNQKRSRVVLTVTDSGQGISRDYLESRLFKPFAQENPLNPGTGLGLSMVHQIVTAMGGEITVESTVGKGTEIQVHVTMVDATNPPLPDGPPPVTAEAEQRFHGLKIAFVGAGDHAEPDASKERADKSNLVAFGKQFRGWFDISIDTISRVQDAGDASIIMTNVQRLPDIMEDLLTLRKPVFVLCENASRARHAYSECESLMRAVAVEIISQPFGPRKMARALMASKERQNSIPGIEGAVVQRDTELPDCSVHPHKKNARPALAPTARKSSESKPGARKEDEKQGNDKSKLRMLLVDDNKINLQLLVRYCKSKGHEFSTAEDGVEAVEAFTKDPPGHRFDFICMDISMPRMDGLEATRRIRQFELANNLEATKVIALTGLASAEAQQEAFSSGVDLFMTKPVRLKELGEVLSGKNRS